MKTTIRFGKPVSEFFLHESISERWERLEKLIGVGSELPAPAAAEEDHPVVEDLLLGEDAEAAAAVVAQLDAEGRATVTEFEQEAARVVSGGVKLIDGSLSESVIAAQIKSSSIGQVRGAEDGYVLIVYDVKEWAVERA